MNKVSCCKRRNIYGTGRVLFEFNGTFDRNDEVLAFFFTLRFYTSRCLFYNSLHSLRESDRESRESGGEKEKERDSIAMMMSFPEI